MGESICAKCAKGRLGGVSSCVSPFVGKDPGFWLTLSDVARIVKRTKIDPDEFCRFTAVDEDELEDDDDLDERHSDLMEYNDKVLLMNGNNKCFFLGEKGCTIFEDRPKMCRVFPFWFTERGGDIRITIQHEDNVEDDECLVTKVNFGSYDIPHLLKFIGETEKSMKECIRGYIEEMELHAKYKHELEKKPILQVLKDNGFVDKDLETRKVSESEKKKTLPVINN